MKLSTEEHAEIKAVLEQRGYDSFQGAFRDLMLKWARSEAPDPLEELRVAPTSGFLRLAATFEASAPAEIRDWVEDTMKRFVREDQEDSRPRQSA